MICARDGCKEKVLGIYGKYCKSEHVLLDSIVWGDSGTDCVKITIGSKSWLNTCSGFDGKNSYKTVTILEVTK